MDDLDNSFNADDVSEVDETGSSNSSVVRDAFEEVVATMAPFMSDQNPEKLEKLRDGIKEMGMKSISHMSVLKESDRQTIFPDLFSVVDFRLMIKKISSDDLGASACSASPNLTYRLDLKSLLSKKFYERLVKDEDILTMPERSKLVLLIADDIMENMKHISTKYVLKLALKVVKDHPTCIGCLKKDESDFIEAAESLKNSIMNRITYIRGSKRSCTPEGGKKAKRPRFTKAQNYGLDPNRDLPNSLPPQETPQTQEAKRALMVQMHESGNPLNLNSVFKMMRETYYTQRRDIHQQLTIEKLLKRWPFIGHQVVLQEHFEYLKEIDITEALSDLKTLFPKLEEFFTAETNRKRSGSRASIPNDLLKILKTYHTGTKSSSTFFITIILCCMIFMEVPQDRIFVCFEETTSYDEIQASDRFHADGKPVIAVLGNHVQANPKAYLVIENRCISETQSTFSQALKQLLMSYFVFKIEYAKETTPILEFMQRKLFKIKDEGTRTARERSEKGVLQAAPPHMSAKYTDLTRKFNAYLIKWNKEL